MLVLVMAIGAFAAVVAINHSSAPTAEAEVVNPFTGFAFGVGQTNTLQSFNQEGVVDNTPSGPSGRSLAATTLLSGPTKI